MSCSVFTFDAGYAHVASIGESSVDELSGLSRPVHEHRAGEDELLYLEVELAQPAQQAAGALDGDLFVLRARLAEEVVVSREMDHRGDVCPVVLADGAQSVAHALVGRELDGDVHAARRRRTGRFAVETHHVLEAPGEPAHHGLANPSAGTADQDDPPFGRHGRPHFAAPNVIPVGSSPTLKVRATVWSITLISDTVSSKRLETNTRLPSLVATRP